MENGNGTRNVSTPNCDVTQQFGCNVYVFSEEIRLDERIIPPASEQVLLLRFDVFFLMIKS